MAPKHQLQDRAEIYQIIKSALESLGRSDEPYSYGVANDYDPGQLIIYFDVPRISPLQFNLTFDDHVSREHLVERIKEAIKRRLEIRSGQ